MNRRSVAPAVLALALALTACGGNDAGEAAGTTASSTAGTPTSGTPTCEPAEATAEPAAGISADLAEAPVVPASDAPPPCGLVVGDVVVGTGAEAVAGSTVEAKYVGAFYGTGEEFDSSWSRGADETFSATLGVGQVIEGFDQGLTGMQVGGRRVVTIPSELGYGPAGQGPIPGGATLVFVMDLVSVG